MKARILSLVVGIFFFAQLSNASHLIGGEMTYRCLGGDQYEITLLIYRDCNEGNAPYDESIPLTIRQDGYTSDVPDSTKLWAVEIPLDSSLIELIPEFIDEDKCIEAVTGYCAEKVYYRKIVTLPNNGNAYHIIHQRCCRPEDVLNIIDPEHQGNTYYVTITPQAMAVCNNSPVFNEIPPPPVICTNQNSSMNFSAIDEDGDSLVYELFHPIVGGGGDNTLPNPASSPKYNRVVFQAGFNYSNPMGINVGVYIGQDGILKTLPKSNEVANGGYVVGVKVMEYRNGEILSTIYRDYVLRATSCTNFAYDINITKDELNECEQTEITFLRNQNTEVNDTVFFFWSGDAEEGLDYTTSESNQLHFSQGQSEAKIQISGIVDSLIEGEESIELRLTPQNSCITDTTFPYAEILLNEAPPIQVSLPDDRVVCPGEMTDVTINSLSGGNAESGYNYVWYINHQEYSTLEEITIQANHTSQLKLFVSDNCGSEAATDSMVILTDDTQYSIALEPLTSFDELYEGCSKLRLVFRRDGDLNRTEEVQYRLSGTATSGHDYNGVPLTPIILAGKDSSEFVLNILSDNSSEEPETIIAELIPGLHCVEKEKPEASILDAPSLTLTLPEDTTVGAGNNVQVKAITTGGVGEYTYLWNDEAGTDSVSLSVNQDTILLVKVMDECGSEIDAKDSISIFYDPIISGMNNTTYQTLKVYPNPSDGTFYLNLNSQRTLVLVRNSLGQVVLQQMINKAKSAMLQLDQLPNGIYQLEVQEDGGKRQAIIVKK